MRLGAFLMKGKTVLEIRQNPFHLLDEKESYARN